MKQHILHIPAQSTVGYSFVFLVSSSFMEGCAAHVVQWHLSIEWFAQRPDQSGFDHSRVHEAKGAYAYPPYLHRGR
jgi:hypothetical protein